MVMRRSGLGAIPDSDHRSERLVGLARQGLPATAWFIECNSLGDPTVRSPTPQTPLPGGDNASQTVGGCNGTPQAVSALYSPGATGNFCKVGLFSIESRDLCVVTYFPHQFRLRRWAPLEAYGAPTLIGASRITEGNHVPNIVLVDSVMGWLVGHYLVNKRLSGVVSNGPHWKPDIPPVFGLHVTKGVSQLWDP